jgi:hypothetical protein
MYATINSIRFEMEETIRNRVDDQWPQSLRKEIVDTKKGLHKELHLRI